MLDKDTIRGGKEFELHYLLVSKPQHTIMTHSTAEISIIVILSFIVALVMVITLVKVCIRFSVCHCCDSDSDSLAESLDPEDDDDFEADDDGMQNSDEDDDDDVESDAVHGTDTRVSHVDIQTQIFEEENTQDEEINTGALQNRSKGGTSNSLSWIVNNTSFSNGDLNHKVLHSTDAIDISFSHCHDPSTDIKTNNKPASQNTCSYKCDNEIISLQTPSNAATIGAQNSNAYDISGNKPRDTHEETITTAAVALNNTDKITTKQHKHDNQNNMENEEYHLYFQGNQHLGFSKDNNTHRAEAVSFVNTQTTATTTAVAATNLLNPDKDLSVNNTKDRHDLPFNSLAGNNGRDINKGRNERSHDLKSEEDFDACNRLCNADNPKDFLL